MIKGLVGERHITVTGGNTSVPYVDIGLDKPMAGAIRISGTEMQVFNGTCWISMNTSCATVGLSNAAQEAIDWAQYKMQEERNMELLKDQYPYLTEAIEEVEQAKQALQTLIALTKEYDEDHDDTG
jgi:predicted Zn-dependent protease